MSRTNFTGSQNKNVRNLNSYSVILKSFHTPVQNNDLSKTDDFAFLREQRNMTSFSS